MKEKAASSTAPDTWSTFEQAEWAVENGHYDHIGYVFADQNIVGIDIDAGFEDGLMTPLCADIMQACHSYTEKSRVDVEYISSCVASCRSQVRTILQA